VPLYENYMVCRDVCFPLLARDLIPFVFTFFLGKVLPSLASLCLFPPPSDICQEISGLTPLPFPPPIIQHRRAANEEAVSPSLHSSPLSRYAVPI